MFRDKRHLAASDAPLREKLGVWVRLTYVYYNRNPAVFTVVLTTRHDARGSVCLTATGQGERFLEMIARARDCG